MGLQLFIPQIVCTWV